MRIGILVVLAVVLLGPRASAQSFEAGAHFTSAKWSEFEGNDYGIGARLSWMPVSMIGIDADITFYPSEFPPDTVGAWSARRIETLFGATVGPRLNRVRPFAKAAAGVLKVAETQTQIACIAIYPPPLSCLMFGGRTMTAYEIGGGVAIDATSKAFIRADVTERFLKYPGPSFRGPGLRETVDEDFFAGALRFSVGAGVRF
jgi:hypothetical protein